MNENDLLNRPSALDSDTALAQLRRLEPELRQFGVASLYLFGSLARGEAESESDVDLFFERQPGRRLSLLDVIGIRHFLEDQLHSPVDLILRESLHPMLRGDIEAEAVAVF
ncbi:MAG: nucleotidyltransferase family protein [Terricaulis sp.]